MLSLDPSSPDPSKDISFFKKRMKASERRNRGEYTRQWVMIEASQAGMAAAYKLDKLGRTEEAIAIRDEVESMWAILALTKE